MNNHDHQDSTAGGLQRGKSLFEVPQGKVQDDTSHSQHGRKSKHRADKPALGRSTSTRNAIEAYNGNAFKSSSFPPDRTIAELMKKCTFKKGYYYAPGLAPGFEMFRYIARSHDSKRPLRMWIPDTIVHGLEAEGTPYWIYSNKNGIVKCRRRFTQQQMIERIGSRRYEDDLVALAKEPQYSTVHRGLLQYDGNNSSVVSTRSLKQMVADKTSFSGTPLVIQRYVKSKGSKACIVRACFRLGKPSEMWQLGNIDRFNATNPGVEGRGTPADAFILNNSQASTMTVYAMRRQAKTEYERHNRELVSFLESVLKRRISELVADYLKDDFDQIWFLKVKGYRFYDEMPKSISGGGGFEEGLDTNGSDDESPGGNDGGSRSRRRRMQLGHSGLFSRKCRFCSSIYPLENLRFKMTTQMILDTAGHLRSRMSRARYQKLLASQAGGDLGLDASRLYHAHKVCRTCFELYHHEKELKAVEAMFARSIGLAIPLQPMLDTSDDMLKCIEMPALPASPRRRGPSDLLQSAPLPGTGPSSQSVVLSPIGSPGAKLGAAISSIDAIADGGRGRGRLVAQGQDRLGLRSPGSAEGRGRQMSGVIQGVLRRTFQGGSGGKSVVNGEEYSQQEAYGGSTSSNRMHDVAASMPPEVTLCRFLIAVHAIHDVPLSLVEELRSQPNTSVILRFSILNKEYDVPVNLQLCKFSEYRNRTTSVLPLFYFRVYCCFSPDTPLKGALPEHSGIATYLETQKHLQLRLLKGSRGAWAELGAGSIPLAQFKSDYVKSVEQYVPLGLNLELCSVKVTVGVERTRCKVDSGILSNIKFHKGLYVPHSRYYTGDPLPREWMTALQVTNHEPRLDEHESAPLAEEPSLTVDAEAPEAEKGAKYVNPLSPVKAVPLPNKRQDSSLYQRLQSELDDESRRAVHGGVPPLSRSPSFTGGRLSKQGSFYSARGTKDSAPEPAENTSLPLRKNRSSADIAGERKSGRFADNAPLMPIHVEESSSPSQVLSSPSTLGGGSATSSHLRVGPASSETIGEEELFCIRVNIDGAKNMHLPPEIRKFKRWHAFYELFGRQFRSCVTDISNHTSLDIQYSKKHYVWSTKAGLSRFFGKHNKLVIHLAHSMPLDESSRMEDLDMVFQKVDEDKSGCVTRKQLVEALEVIVEQLEAGVPPSKAEVSREVLQAREASNNAGNARAAPATPSPTGEAEEWHLGALGTMLRAYWTAGAIGSGVSALLEASTLHEFVDIGLLVLRLRQWFLKIGGDADPDSRGVGAVYEGLKAEATHLFYPVHETSREDHTLFLAATSHKDAFMQLIHEYMESGDEGAEKLLHWDQLVRFLHTAVNGSNTCKYGGSLGADSRMVCPLEEDQEQLTCTVPLDSLHLGGDAVDNTFDLKLASEDSGDSLKTDKVTFSAAMQTMRELCAKMKSELSTGPVPLPMIRKWTNNNLKQESPGASEVQAFLSQFTGGGRMQNPKSGKAKKKRRGSKTKEGSGVESQSPGEYSSEDFDFSTSLEASHTSSSTAQPNSQISGDTLNTSATLEGEDDYLSSSEDEGDSSGNFSEDFRNDETSVGDQSTNFSQESKGSGAIPKQKKKTSKEKQKVNPQDLVIIAAPNTLKREFEVYLKEKGVASIDENETNYPAYMQVSIWVYGTDTNGSMLSPTKYAMTRLDDRGEVLLTRFG